MSKSKIVTIPSFYASKLNNYRDIYVYLPPNYDVRDNKHYPVLYMHDGQNIFHPAKGTNESWNVHKACDDLISKEKMQEIIVVGIPNMGSERGSEYTHFISPSIKASVPEFKGLMYEDFIINELKPYIDTHFRTLKDCSNTALMGSSMGGLVTYHIGFRNPGIFGKLGIVSPFMMEMNKDTLELNSHYEKYEDKKPLKLWIDVGGYEGAILIEHVRSVVDELSAAGYKEKEELTYYCDYEAAHTEKAWADRMTAILLYFFGDIGQPVSVEIEGGNIIGLTGAEVRIQPTVKYDSGFVMSAINGQYTVEDPSILEVKQNGIIKPKAEGRTKVSFEFDGITVSKEYTVINHLSKLVKVVINVSAPKEIDTEAVYVYGFKIYKKEDGLYSRELEAPRDLGIRFSICRENAIGSDTYEVDENGNLIERELKATEDMTVNYEVKQWFDRI